MKLGDILVALAVIGIILIIIIPINTGVLDFLLSLNISLSLLILLLSMYAEDALQILFFHLYYYLLHYLDLPLIFQLQGVFF